MRRSLCLLHDVRAATIVHSHAPSGQCWLVNAENRGKGAVLPADQGRCHP
jgi:hypothetical protein